jgi:transcriptional regulator with GAF, ATPase, and Fis domain
MWQTREDSVAARRVESSTRPGLVVVWSDRAPVLRAVEIDRDGVVLGRELLASLGLLDDDRLSRQHARLHAVPGGLVVTDLGSRNGTHVAGARIEGETWVHGPTVIRAGRTIAIAVPDVRRFLDARVERAGDAVVGPTLADAWRRIERAARTGDNLLVTGESGTGKELAARAFHAASGGPGELVSVNCAAIPAGVAERLLFGTRRGAYSGADHDADGYLVAADRGTLFLDEIGELEAAVQAKLLRALESREVLPLGAARPRRIELRVVAATLRDLREEVAERRFRADLYHRIGRPEVHLAPLRERLEDIPWLAAHTAERAAPGLALSPALIETCLLRPWPGNARELIGELRRAALAARDTGAGELGASDLEPTAGLRIERRAASSIPGALPGPVADAAPAVPAAPARTAPPAPLPDRDTVARVLAAEGGNVVRTARALGLHRNQLRRFLARHPDLARRSADEHA